MNFAKTAPAGSMGLATIHEHKPDDISSEYAPQHQTRAQPIVGAFITSNDELQSPVRARAPRPYTAPSSSATSHPTSEIVADTKMLAASGPQNFSELNPQPSFSLAGETT